MKSLITLNLLKFTVVTVLLTLIFRIGLSASIENKMIISIVICAILYAVFMLLNGSYYGRRDYDDLPIYDIGFRFHFSTFLAHNLISILWFLFSFQSKYENIRVIYITAGVWLVFIVIHLFYYLSSKKSSIKNLDKENLFE